jgi:hypothetical protein
MNCSHSGCHCPAQGFERDGRQYCSEECASQGNQQTAGGCRCGHATCA